MIFTFSSVSGDGQGNNSQELINLGVPECATLAGRHKEVRVFENAPGGQGASLRSTSVAQGKMTQERSYCECHGACEPVTMETH